MSEFKPGHLSTSDESKIGNLKVVNGRTIYSEKSGLQFVDYADKRHTYGPILTCIFNDTGYVDFTQSTLNDSLAAIKANGFVVDGQIIKVDGLYKYRKIGDNNLITKIDESNVDIDESKVGFVIYLSEYETDDLVNMDLLLSVYNETNGIKLFLVKIIDNEIDMTKCQDMDGTFNPDTFSLSIAHNGSGLFTLTANTASSLKVVSYSVSSSGSSKNEGLYVVASDL